MDAEEGRNDGNDPSTQYPPRGGTAYPRKRAAVACQVCRARRTKCDNKKPACSFCVSIGASCVSVPVSLSAFDPASLKILERLDELERKLDRSFSGHQGYVRPEDKPAVEVRHGLLPLNLQNVLEWPVFKPYLGNEIGNERIPSPISSVSAISDPPLGFSGELDAKTGQDLVDNFFHHVHIKNPILDEFETRRLIRKVCLNGVGWDAESCLALLVCANGAAASPFPTDNSRSRPEVRMATSLFQAGQKRIGSLLETGGVIQAQCLFLSGVYLMCMLRAFDAWCMFLQALAACQRFNCVAMSSSSEFGASGSPAEERIYWSCWKSERELRWELGLPDFGNSNLDYPRLFPSLPDGCVGEVLQSWYFYLSEISLWRLNTYAKDAITKFVPKRKTSTLEGLAEISVDLEEQVTSWQQSLAPPVSLDGPSSATEESDVLRFILRGHVSNYYELIMWPFIHATINQGEQDLNVQQWAAKGLQWHLNRLIINSPGFNHRHHGTWLMQRSSTRSALVLLAAAFTPHAAMLMPSRWKYMVESTIQMLYFWQEEIPDAGVHARLLNLLLSSCP